MDLIRLLIGFLYPLGVEGGLLLDGEAKGRRLCAGFIRIPAHEIPALCFRYRRSFRGRTVLHLLCRLLCAVAVHRKHHGKDLIGPVADHHPLHAVLCGVFQNFQPVLQVDAVFAPDRGIFACICIDLRNDPCICSRNRQVVTASDGYNICIPDRNRAVVDGQDRVRTQAILAPDAVVYRYIAVLDQDIAIADIRICADPLPACNCRLDLQDRIADRHSVTACKADAHIRISNCFSGYFRLERQIRIFDVQIRSFGMDSYVSIQCCRSCHRQGVVSCIADRNMIFTVSVEVRILQL